MREAGWRRTNKGEDRLWVNLKRLDSKKKKKKKNNKWKIVRTSKLMWQILMKSTKSQFYSIKVAD